MEFKDITTWSVSKGVATPVNEHEQFVPRYNFNGSIAGQSRNVFYYNFEKEAQQHTYATNAPDGSYSADCFGKVVYQYKLRSELNWTTDLNAETYKNTYDYFEYNTKMIYSCFETRQLLPFIDQVKEAESPKFGEWISVKDRLPENRNWCLVMCNKELFLSNYKHGIFETEKPLILHGVTHWMPLPSPPKTL